MTVIRETTFGMMFQKSPDILTVSQLSHVLNINEKKAYQLVREKRINCFKVGRAYRIPKVSVLDYINTMTEKVDLQTCHIYP